MNTQTDTAIVNPMQEIEAFPLEDHSLPASEVLAEQRAELDGNNASAPVFIP